MEILWKAFERCRCYKFCTNPLKCAFEMTTRKFLKFLIHQREIEVHPLKVKVIITMKPPTSVKDLKSFIGKLSYIWMFIPALALRILVSFFFFFFFFFLLKKFTYLESIWNALFKWQILWGSKGAHGTLSRKDTYMRGC